VGGPTGGRLECECRAVGPAERAQERERASLLLRVFLVRLSGPVARGRGLGIGGRDAVYRRRRQCRRERSPDEEALSGVSCLDLLEYAAVGLGRKDDPGPTQVDAATELPVASGAVLPVAILRKAARALLRGDGRRSLSATVPPTFKVQFRVQGLKVREGTERGADHGTCRPAHWVGGSALSGVPGWGPWRDCRWPTAAGTQGGSEGWHERARRHNVEWAAGRRQAPGARPPTTRRSLRSIA
jgi:hypothetical protein